MAAVRDMLRSLARTPGFTLSVVVTLGLAIGANAAVFTLVDQVVFRPLPVEKPAELVVVNATLGQVAAAGLARERLLVALSSAFGALAAALSAMGVLGLTGYLATRRTHEIGVRLALGCPRGRATRLVMREAAWLAATGALAGGALYLGASRYLRSALYELSPTDPVTTFAAVGVLTIVALAAAYAPARRASRVDPAVTLRSE